MSRPRYFICFALSWFALGGPVAAQAARVAALAPRIDPPTSAALRDRFHDAITRGLKESGVQGLETLGASEVRQRLLASEELLNCQAGPCLGAATSELRVDRLALGEITVSGRSYAIVLRLVDQGGAEIWRVADGCDICNVAEVEKVLVRAVTKMAPWVMRPGPSDQTELEQERTRKAESELRIPFKQPAPQVQKGPSRPPEPRANGYRIGWISALVVGGLFVAGSIPFLYYGSRDGQTSCDPSVPRRECPTVYQGNLNTGLGLLLGGGILGAGGAFVVLYYLDHRAQRRSGVTHASILPLHGGALLGVEGRF